MTKYRAKPEWFDGIYFRSQKELRRYHELKLLFKARKIQSLEVQPRPFKLLVEGALIESYRPDFIYYENGQRIVEDVKGHKTKDYRRKKKWMKALYQIEIRET